MCKLVLKKSNFIIFHRLIITEQVDLRSPQRHHFCMNKMQTPSVKHRYLSSISAECKALAMNVHNRRLSIGLTQREVASACGICPDQINAIEKGSEMAIRELDFDRILALAGALSTEPWQLFNQG